MQKLLRDKNGRFASKSKVKKLVAKIYKPVKQKKNQIIFVIDKSGSMNHLRQEVREKYGELLSEIKKNNDKFNQKTEVSLYQFNNYCSRDYQNQNLSYALGAGINYSPNGGTAMFDALAKAITDGISHPDYNDEDTSFLVMVLTDGQENSSHLNDAHDINRLLKVVNATDRWSVTFQVPPGGKNTLVKLGVFSDNIIEWEGTKEGFERVSGISGQSLGSYYNARHAGETKTCGFFTPDLSQVSKNISKLDDLSDQYNLLTVHVIGKKSIGVRDYVQALGKSWITGSVFYELDKVELVQYNKQILIRDKTTNEVYGGKQARDLIGLPDKNVKVNPVDHKKYAIYPQSTSVNRALKNGQTILLKK